MVYYLPLLAVSHSCMLRHVSKSEPREVSFFSLFRFIFLLFTMEVEGNEMEKNFFCLCNTLSCFPT